MSRFSPKAGEPPTRKTTERWPPASRSSLTIVLGEDRSKSLQQDPNTTTCRDVKQNMNSRYVYICIFSILFI